ncbi:hypothetical protein BN59_01639 [Legionella massiliensis]|uniref:Uncharacterized protein n=1 Tax=Legionella massiliensis TaxID=1034943 RepID=A0A078KWJ3_9GAMM|nr:hypothetical protein [Legionella massiliensis]CDZ77356.1 hypothetical protein BN59_01639 [Legionella massiliensis]CEE13094.1 hypothetical protein BN1094_01639 [Legionella massiliensis]
MLKIKEIVISSPTSGETNLSSYQIKNGRRPLIIAMGHNSSDRVYSMLGYITNLMQNAAIAHSANLQENAALHDGSELITRVSLDEFSFYPKDRPLTIDEYRYIIGEVYKLAKTLPPNVHIQLATFPVYWPNGVVQNCNLYVQSPKRIGQEPLIHHMSKENASHIDFQYGYLNQGVARSIPLTGDRPDLDKRCEPGQDCDPNLVLRGTGVAVYDVNQYKNALRITSANGQKALQVVDICLDHAYGVGKQHLSALMTQLGLRREHVPVLASHIISSKTIDEEEANAAATVVHADVRNGKVGKHKPVFAKQAVNFNVGGFGANAQYSVYQPKVVGFLSGKDFDKAINYNFLGHPVNVNAIYGNGTTMLHDIVNDITTETDLKRTLSRIQTLQKYGLSIDIPNAQGFTVRELVCRQTVNALNSRDDVLSLMTMQIAKQLGITTNQIIASDTPKSPLAIPPKIEVPPKVNPNNILDNFIERTIIEFKIKNKVDLSYAQQIIENQLFDYYLGKIEVDKLSEIYGFRQKFIDGTFSKQMIMETFKDYPDFQSKIARHEERIALKKEIAELKMKLASKEHEHPDPDKTTNPVNKHSFFGTSQSAEKQAEVENAPNSLYHD